MKYNFEKFCKDYRNIENYDKAATDNFEGWCCHHRRQTWDSNGERLEADVSAAELIALGQYYNVSADELIFLTASEHMSLHNKGKKFSEEHREKLSEAKKGKPKTEEHKKKISEAKKGHIVSGEVRNKISKARKVMRWFNNGKINKFCYECPEGFIPGMLKRK